MKLLHPLSPPHCVAVLDWGQDNPKAAQNEEGVADR